MARSDALSGLEAGRLSSVSEARCRPPRPAAYYIGGNRMATLQQQVVEKFLAQLAESKEVSAEKIEKLRSALSAVKKPKADDFAKIFTEPDHGDIK